MRIDRRTFMARAAAIGAVTSTLEAVASSGIERQSPADPKGSALPLHPTGDESGNCDRISADLGWRSGDPTLETKFKEGHQSLDLNGTWLVTPLPLQAEGDLGYKIFKQGGDECMPSAVPGEIHLDLMRAGRMSDPNVGDNARMRCRWPEQHSWWYWTEFVLPAGFRDHWKQQLIFEGIDLYGQIFLNGQLIGETRDAFSSFDFDVKPVLRDGRNELVVRVTSGMELPRPSNYLPLPDPQDYGALYLDRFAPRDVRRYLRKPAYSAYGWDFCDPLPNIGICRGVHLEGHSQVVIDHLRLDTIIRGEEVSLEGEIAVENLHPWSEIPYVLQVRVDPPKGEPSLQQLMLGAPVGRSTVACRFRIADPQLWWPNGMGGQPLYRLTVRVVCADQETDRRVQVIGLRTLELQRPAVPGGSRFVFKVNGQEVFCKGGNWAPADLIPARVDGAQYRRFVQQAKDAHFTMLRVNGVGLYEAEEFYDACDRAGILVWQDFTFSCAQYPDEDAEFLARVRQEAATVVRRLRHHPSLALWCANNECTWYTFLWKLGPAQTEANRGVRLYSEVLPEICRAFDPVRPYWPGSPSGGSEPNSETSGDTHGFAGTGTVGPPDQLTQEVVDRCHARFISEYASIGPPHIASMREYLSPQQLTLSSTVFKIHTNVFDATSGGYVARGIALHYGDSHNLSLEQFVLYGQMFQAQLQSRVLEAARFRKGDVDSDCQGALVWSFNDTWGEIGWSIVDHYGRRKASYYAVRRSASPVKVIVRSRNDHLVVRVVNDTRMGYEAKVCCGWVRLDGSANELREHSIAIPTNGVIEVSRVPVPSLAERKPGEWLYAATLTGAAIPDDQAIWLLAPQRELSMEQPVLSTTVCDSVLEVTSPVYCHGVHLDDEGHEILADNYFDLLPGIRRRIPITEPTPTKKYRLAAVMPINVRTSEVVTPA